MRSNRFQTTALAGSISAILFASRLVLADGLVQKLPPDGSWVSFHCNQRQSRDGMVLLEQVGTLEVRSVGRVEERGAPCRWIEFELKLQSARDGSGRSREILKLLIPESSFEPGGDPLDNVVRSWLQQNDRPLVGPDDVSRPHFLDDVYLTGPLKERATVRDTRTVKYQSGELSIDQAVTGTSSWARVPTSESSALETITHHRLYLHDRVPFGVAATVQKVDIRVNGRAVKRVEIEHNLIAFGTGAVSALPEAD